jgi:hypothetical protein
MKMNKLFNFFSKETPDLEFVDSSRHVYSHYPILLAKDVKPFFKEFQEKDQGSYNFPGCPGMHDYSRMGYLITAWVDIHVKANKAGTAIRYGTSLADKAAKPKPHPFENPIQINPPELPLKEPFPMSTDVTNGLFTFGDDIKPTAFNMPGPWKIFGKKNVSALLLPAFYHCPYLEDLYLYPGVVDYREFTTANVIFSPKRRIDLTIPAGTPLLQVIPFKTTDDFSASFGPGTVEQLDSHKSPKKFYEGNWYRKYYMIKKKFKLEKYTGD